MKILYISGAIFPSEVSHTLSKMRMCQAFTDAGHNVMLSAAAADDDPDTNQVIKYYGLKGGFSLHLKKLSSLWDNRITRKFLLRGFFLALHHRRAIKSFQPDLIYSRLTSTELMFVPRGVPLVYEMHSLGPLGKDSLTKTIFKLLLRTKPFSRIVVTTNALAEMLRCHIHRAEIVVARLSAEDPVVISPRDLDKFRKSNLKGGAFKHHVGYTGYLDTVGLRGTEIICQMAAEMPEAAFHVVGGEPHIVEHWKLYAEAHNKNNNLFFYGFRNPAEMPFFLECFDVVLAPLQYRPNEGAPIGQGMSPLKLPQYMSYKKAIVASDIPAHREVLNNDESAILVSPNDVAEWVNAVGALLHAPEKCLMLGTAAYREYLDRFTAQGRVRTILRDS